MKFVVFGGGACLGHWPGLLGYFMVRIKHSDDVTRSFVYFFGMIVGRFVSLVRYMDASW